MVKKSMILGMMLALGLFFIGFSSQGLAEEKGLVGYWKFDEGKGDVAKDSSANNLEGRIYGADWVEGKKGKALEWTTVFFLRYPNAIISECISYALQTAKKTLFLF